MDLLCAVGNIFQRQTSIKFSKDLPSKCPHLLSQYKIRGATLHTCKVEQMLLNPRMTGKFQLSGKFENFILNAYFVVTNMLLTGLTIYV